ncbi:vWA domain-containing protein [Actinophytocola sediminis]
MYHVIIAVDVEDFASRDESHRTAVRETLATAMSTAFERCGLPWEHCQREDRDDGILVYLPPDRDNKRLIEGLPTELAGLLRQHNATADEQTRIRLRIVLHAGEIDRDRQGLSGPAVVHAGRLLESDELKDALTHSSGILALITSDEFFRSVLIPDLVVNVRRYERVVVAVRETRATAWICLPDQRVPHRTHNGRGQHREPGRRRLPTGVALLTVLLLVCGLATNVLAAQPPARRCVEPIQVNVNVSAEKERVIQELAADFEDAERDEQGCHGVTVQVTVARSADAVIGAIARGWGGLNDLPEVGPEPHVLLPDSSLEYEAALAALRAEGRQDVVLDHRGPIAFSPLILARPRQRGATPEQPNTWDDLLATARRDQRTHRPSPVSSGAGLVATVALYAAVLDQHLDRDTLTAAAAPGLLHGVEQAVAADNDGETALCSLTDDTVLVSEKVAIEYNEGSPAGGRCAPPDGARLELSHPREGTLYLDHPFITVTWRERPANPVRERALHRLHQYLTGPHGQDALRRAWFRDRDRDLAPITDVPPGRPPELTVGTVDVGAVLAAFHAARKSARVQILVDVSSAMAEPFLSVGGTRLSAATDAVDRVLRSVGERDAVGLWMFAAGLAGTVDHKVLAPVRPGGADATSAALDQVRGSDRPARLYGTVRAAVAGLLDTASGSASTNDAVVIVAAGTSTASEQDHTRLVDYLRTSGVPVFLIAFGTGVCVSTRWQEITGDTGGACHEAADIKDFDEALDSVAAVLWGGGHG